MEWGQRWHMSDVLGSLGVVLVFQQPLRVFSDTWGESGVDGVAVGGLEEDGCDGEFGESAVGCCENVGKGVADAGRQFWGGSV